MAVKKSDIIKAVAHVGKEPLPETPGELIVGIELVKNFNWYTYVYDHDNAKEFLVNWATKTNHPSLKFINKLSARRLSVTKGWIARMLSNGFSFEESTLQRFEEYLNEIEGILNKRSDLDEEDNKQGEDIHTPSSPYETLTYVLYNINSLSSPFLISSYFSEAKVTKVVAEEILNQFTEIQSKLAAAISKLTKRIKNYDPKLLSQLTKLRKQYKFTDEVITYAEKHMEKRSVVQRKPRRLKPKTPAQLIKNFKFMKSHEDTGIKSIEADKIIGSQILYAWNTQNNTLSIFKAKNEKGLSVNRTSIDNFDENQSKSKRVGRYLKDILNTIQMGSKPQRINVLEKAKTEFIKTFSPRLNNNTILLRVEK